MENLCIVNGPEEINYIIKCMHAYMLNYFIQSVKFYNSVYKFYYMGFSGHIMLFCVHTQLDETLRVNIEHIFGTVFNMLIDLGLFLLNF